MASPDYQFAWSAQYLIGSCLEKLRASGSLPASEANARIEQAYKEVVEKYPNGALTANACLKLGNLNLKRGKRLEGVRYIELFLAKAHRTHPGIESAKARLAQLKGEEQ